MSELEYEVTFGFGSINVTTIALVDEYELSDDETLEDVAVRRAGEIINIETGLNVDNAEGYFVKHTGTYRG